ncbi:flotillin domain-containing protein [Rhizodiscina lignyota]|uniref:Flotillin domain-containing protein n=1 Tax=Rhizodiscina lignyota TaxID=1504668 RepID=A0A9P4M892_9PEZI|nr:flotillin domain-containing protein [Rhizodiscina lignyota]
MMWYHVAEPNSYLVITGAGIEKVLIKKKALVYPFQKVTKISITPFDFSMNLQAMTIEKLKFSLPAVFTIGPDDSLDSLQKYAILLTGEADGTKAVTTASGAVAVGSGRSHVQDIVKGIIEGETRSIVSTMTMEELFKERKVFKDKVIHNVQSELDQFGLRIYNANVKELQDTPGSEYFAFLSRKAHEGALNQAKVDVADARMRGEIGEAEKLGRTKQEIAKINAATAVLETERKGEKATADAKLTDKEIQIGKELKLARIIAQRAAEERDTELQTVVEQKRAEMELERLRATTVTQAKIARESAQQQADADLYSAQKRAEGVQYERKAESDARFYAEQREADAAFYARQKEAEGLGEMAKAYGHLAQALGGPQGLMQYLMLKDGTYTKLAEANATAVKGMQPKISVWNTGAQGEADATAPIRNLFQSLPPLLETINDQTGIQPPQWLARMPQQEQAQPTNGQQLVGKKAQVNGTH